MLGAGNKENSSGTGGFGGFSLGGATPAGPSAPAAPKGGAAPGGFSFGALGSGGGGGVSQGSADDGLPPKGGFAFGGASDAGGGASTGVDPPPSAPRSGLSGGLSLAGGPKIDLPKPGAAPAKPLEATKSGGFAFGGAAAPAAAAAAAPAKPVLSLAKVSLPTTPAAKAVGFSLQPLGGGGSSALAMPAGSSGTSVVAQVGNLPDAPDLVGPTEQGSGSNRALLNGLRGPYFATLLSSPATQQRLTMLTQMYSGPPVVAQDKEALGGALGKSLTPRTAEMRGKKMIYAHMTQPGPSRKKLEPAEDGRDDGWIDQLSFGTNLQQKQAFQIWQLFRETMLEADHAATRPSGSKDLLLARAVMPSTVDELGAVKEPTVAQGSRQSLADTLEFYLSERLDVLRCAIVALAPGNARRGALQSAGLSARQMLHSALFILAETAEDRAGSRGGEGSEQQLLEKWPHVGERHVCKPVERALRLPLSAHDRARVDSRLREREPRQQVAISTENDEFCI